MSMLKTTLINISSYFMSCVLVIINRGEFVVDKVTIIIVACVYFIATSSLYISKVIPVY